MKTGKKIAIGVGALVLVGAIVGFTVHQSGKGVVVVQTGKVTRQDLTSIVSASGEVKPKTYVNIGANGYGKITKLFVHEGETVKRGQLLAKLDYVQSAADVAAMQAQLAAAKTDYAASEAMLKSAQSDLDKARADHDRARLDYQRGEALYGQQLIPKQDFDGRKAAFESADAAITAKED